MKVQKCMVISLVHGVKNIHYASLMIPLLFFFALVAVITFTEAVSGEVNEVEFMGEYNYTNVGHGPILDIIFAPDDGHVVLAGTGKTFWDLDEGTYIGMSLSTATCLAYDRGSMRLASGHESNPLRVYRFTTETPSQENVSYDGALELRAANDITFGAESNIIYTIDGFYIVRWDFNGTHWSITDHLYLYNDSSRDPVMFLHYNHDRGLLVAVMKSADCIMILSDLTIVNTWVNSGYPSPDSKLIPPYYTPFCVLENWTVMWGWERELIQLNLSTGKQVAIQLNSHNDFDHLVISHDGRWLALVDNAGVDIINLTDMIRTSSFLCSDYVTALVFSEDDTRIATTDEKMNLQVWVDVRSPDYNYPPRVNVTSHTSGETVANTITISGTASDDKGVMSILYSIDDGSWAFARGQENWSFDWDTRFHLNGWHTVYIRAFDGEDFSPTVSVMFLIENNATTLLPPQVTLDIPKEGAEVTGEVMFVGRAWGPNHIESVNLSFFGKEIEAELSTSNWWVSVDTRQLPNGTIEFRATAFDGLITSDPAIVNLTVKNTGMANAKPFVRIHSPEDGQEFNFTFIAKGNAADEESMLAFVLVRIDDGQWVAPDPVDGWIYDWIFTYDTWSLENGPHTFQAMCGDDVQVSDIIQVHFIVNNDWEHPYGRPNLQITSPANGSTVKGTIEIKGTADSEPLILEIWISMDGGDPLVAEGTTSWSFVLDTLACPNGPHTIRAWAVGVLIDSEIDELELWVQNDRRPMCEITWPVENQTLVEDTFIRGTAHDPEGEPVIVEIAIDSAKWCACTVDGENWSFVWNISDLEGGKHSLRVRAFDGNLYSSIDNVDVRLVPPDQAPSPEPSMDSLSIAIILTLVAVIITLSVVYLHSRKRTLEADKD